jgi:signal transduction histidine kinase
MIFLDENFIVKGYNDYLIQELGFCDIDPTTMVGTNINEHIPEFVTSMKRKKSYIKIDNRVLQGLFSFYKFTIIIEVSIYSKSFIDFLVNQLKIPCTTSLDVIKRLQNSRLTETQKNYVEIIRKNKILISQTIINMIDYIKSVSRAHVLDTPNEFFLSSAINEIINFTKFNENINIKYSIQNDVVLYTDYKKFIDMLMHIIKNCTKNRKGTISIISKSNTDILSISIHDKNPKLSNKNKASVFVGFMNTEYVKTDLSLPIAKSFARLLGGDLILENSTEEGNIYKFYTSLDDINM